MQGVTTPFRALARTALSMLPGRTAQTIRKAYYAWHLKLASEGDETDLAVVRHLIRHGDSVVDVGACIGLYTKFLSAYVGEEGHVYSVEPIPDTCEILRSNVKALGLANVQVVECAISDSAGHVTMVVPRLRWGGHNLYCSRIVSQNTSCTTGARVVVESKSLDYLCANVSRDISFIKCDAEGHELHCLKGAIGIIRANTPAWEIEISGDPDDMRSSGSEVFRLLNAEGYVAFCYDGTCLKKRRRGERSVNYFFLTPEHLAALQEGGGILLKTDG